MKRAIVLGATGYLGKALVATLVKHNIDVLATGRSSRDKALEHTELKHNKVQYLSFDANNILELQNNKEVQEFVTQDTVCYNLIWRGNSRLRDGSLEEQLNNIEISTNAIVVSAKLGCSKFINVGTQDEEIFSNYINSDTWLEKAYGDNDLNYAASKLVARDMNEVTAYLNKIDYIHTRFSVVLDKSLSGVSFIAKTLMNIIKGQDYPKVQNQNPMEIILLEELAEAYYHIGLNGKNKANYYIGRGDTHTLEEYFASFYQIKQQIDKGNLDNLKSLMVKKTHNFSEGLLNTYNPSSLKEDTNFEISSDFIAITKTILEYVKD